MTVDPHSKDARAIRKLIPFSRIPNTVFEELCAKISIEKTTAGTFLFQRGETANDLLYLLKGSISLQTEEFQVESINSDTEASKFALAHQIPRKIDAFAETDVRFLRLDADMFKSALSAPFQEDPLSMVVDEPEQSNDWLTTLLKSPIFRALPPSNLQRIIMSLEEVVFEKGETIIQQGDEGDYYYLIKSGHCLITRKPTPNAKEIKLAQLRSQDTFGEDSLLSGEPRNVTVRAMTDVTLLRLSKENFVNLIEKPTLKYIDFEQAQTEISNGAILLDVRSPDAYNENHLENSINMPFFSMRMHLKTLAKNQPVIVVCEYGNTGKAAAFLLLRNKIDAFVLKGGMENIPGHYLAGEASFTIDEEGVESNLNPASEIEQETTELVERKDTEVDGSEIIQLKQTITQLEAKCKSLADEKNELAKKYQQLVKQTEKMKAFLDTLKNDNAT